MPFAVLPFLLLVIPITEITVFILVGSQIGLWPTLGLVILTATLGALLLRAQGGGLIRRITGALQAGRAPARELAHGAMLVLAGFLLITPGFVTDTLGLLLFVPSIRERLFGVAVGLVASRVTRFGPLARGPFGSGTGPGTGSMRRGEVVDLDPHEFREGAPDPSSAPDSPWRR